MRQDNIMLGILGALGLGAAAWWYARPLGNKIQDGDEVFVSEIFPVAGGPGIQSFGGRRFVLKVTDARKPEGVVVRVDEESFLPNLGAGLPSASLLATVMNQQASFERTGVSRVMRRGGVLSGSV